MTRYIIALALLFLTVNSADARQRHKPTGMHPMCNITMPCIAPYNSTPEQVRVTRGRYVARQMGFGSAIDKRAVRVPRARPVASYGAPSPSIGHTIAGIVAPLAAKVSEIQASCGSKIISAIRHTYIAGTRHISLHASGQAVDVAGNPSCIYSMLHGWAGGYSIDYARMKHVHISWGGPEQGLRFAHGGGRSRHAHRRNHRYAAAR